MTIRFVTDSASDLSKSTADNLGISVIPLYINIGEKSYLDGIDISRKEFYERLPVLDTPPTTSAPGIATFVKVYQSLIDEGATGIVSVHVASNLSNVHNVAKLAAESIKNFPIEVIDGGNLSLGTGLLTMIGNSVAAADKSMEEVVQTIREMIQRTHTIAVLDTLEYLRRSGRLSHFKFRLGTMLDIKPMIRMTGGVIKLEMIRTQKQAIKRLTEEVEKLAPFEKLAFVHTHAPQETLQQVKSRLANFIQQKHDVIEEEVTPVIGSHIGPGAVGVSLVMKS